MFIELVVVVPTIQLGWLAGWLVAQLLMMSLSANFSSFAVRETLYTTRFMQAEEERKSTGDMYYR